MIFCYSENNRDDVLGGITEAPQMVHDLVGFVHIALHTVLYHVFDQQWMRFITHLK